MPTYEYRCPEGHSFEVFQKMSDEPAALCPDCGAQAERLISGGAGFLFKGDGFYITDYRSDEYKQKASKEAPSEGGSGSGGADKASPGSSGDSGGGGASGSSKPSTTSTDG